MCVKIGNKCDIKSERGHTFFKSSVDFLLCFSPGLAWMSDTPMPYKSIFSHLSSSAEENHVQEQEARGQNAAVLSSSMHFHFQGTIIESGGSRRSSSRAL